MVIDEVDTSFLVWLLFVFPIACAFVGLGVWHLGKHYLGWRRPTLLGWAAGLGSLVGGFLLIGLIDELNG